MKRGGDYKWALSLAVYVMKPGMPLFHITPLNIPFNQDGERPWLTELAPGAWAMNMDGPIYFSLAEEHTMYYDSWDPALDQWRAAHLQFQTKSILKLIDFGKLTLEYDPEFDQWLADQGIDGYVHYDFKFDLWREVYLLAPKFNVDFIGELQHPKTIYQEYPAEAKDQLNLNKHCIGKHKLTDLIVWPH